MCLFLSICPDLFIHLDMQIYPPSYMFVLHANECTWDYDTREWIGRGYSGCWSWDVQRAKKKMRFNLFPQQVCLLFSLLLTSCRERFLRGDTVNGPLLQLRCTKNTLIMYPCFAGLGELLSNLLNYIMDSFRGCYSFYFF